MNKNLDRAKELRRNQTDAEKSVWAKLRARRFDMFKFRRQVPLGSYILDFVCFEARLIIELDGGQHGEAASQTYDAERDDWLRSQGLSIARFWNHQIFAEWEVIEEVLWKTLNESSSAGRGENEGLAKDESSQE